MKSRLRKATFMKHSSLRTPKTNAGLVELDIEQLEAVTGGDDPTVAKNGRDRHRVQYGVSARPG